MIRGFEAVFGLNFDFFEVLLYSFFPLFPAWRKEAPERVFLIVKKL